MHYFLLALLLFPLLLHSYVIINRKSRHHVDLSLIDCRQSPSAKAETPTSGPPVAVEVDNCTHPAKLSKNPPGSNCVPTIGDPVPPRKESTIQVQSDFGTTNVLLEPLRKRAGDEALDGVGVYCAETDD
jgi:hypothetical protein